MSRICAQTSNPPKAQRKVALLIPIFSPSRNEPATNQRSAIRCLWFYLTSCLDLCSCTRDHILKTKITDILIQVPQLYTNYISRSAEGISLAFLSVWFIGDLTNLIGAIWAGLVPLVVALAMYFCFADAVLISQCLYYRNISTSRKGVDDATQDTMSSAVEPLLASMPLPSDVGLPGSRRRSSASQKRRYSAIAPSKSTINLGEKTVVSNGIRNDFCVLAVCMLGGIGWIIAWKIRLWEPTSEDKGTGTAHRVAGAEALGYVSALLYLG